MDLGEMTQMDVMDEEGRDLNGLGSLGAQALVNIALPGVTDKGLRAMFLRYPFGAYGPAAHANFQFKNVTFFHQQDFPATGITEMRFFKDVTDPQRQDTNWPTQTGLPQNQPFWMKGLTAFYGFGVNVDAAAVSGAVLQEQHATASGVLSSSEAIRNVLENHHIQGWIGDVEFVNNHGLIEFPAGVGVGVDGFGATNSATTLINLVSIPHNGGLGLMFRHHFEHPVMVLPQQTLEVRVTSPTAITVPEAGRLKLTAYGTQILRKRVA